MSPRPPRRTRPTRPTRPTASTTTRIWRINARRLEHLASLNLPLHGRTVLEVGAGIGDLTGFFVDRECSVVTTEGRQSNLAVLRSRYPHIDARLLNLDEPDESFDARAEIVFCYGLLYHLARPAEALAFLAGRSLDLLLGATRHGFDSNAAL